MNIKQKSSTVPGKVPLPADLERAEIAVNLADAKLFTKDDNDAIIELGGGGAQYIADLKDVKDAPNIDGIIYEAIFASIGAVVGEYHGIPLTGGSGTGAMLGAIVTPGLNPWDFNIVYQYLYNRGEGYAVGDVLTAANDSLGAGSTGVTATVTKVGRWYVFGKALISNQTVPQAVLVRDGSAPQRDPSSYPVSFDSNAIRLTRRVRDNQNTLNSRTDSLRRLLLKQLTATSPLADPSWPANRQDTTWLTGKADDFVMETNYNNAWQNCTLLTPFPGTLDLSSGTNFSRAWSNCTSLTSFPDTLDMSSGLDFNNAWYGCTLLASFPGALDLGSGTNFNSTWSRCTSLTSFPGTLDLSSGTNFGSAWQDCSAFTSFPGTLDLSLGADFQNTWSGCTALTSFPGTLDLGSGTRFDNAWEECAFTYFPGTLDVSSGDRFDSAWNYCLYLKSFPGTLDVSLGTNFSSTWSNCWALTSFPGTLDLSSGIRFASTWYNCKVLTSFPGTLDLSSGTEFSSAWSSCSSLTSFPGTLDLGSGTNFNNTWSYCTALTSFPGTLDLSSGTDFSSAWQNCTSLTSFPDTLDLSLGTSFVNAWKATTLDQQSVDNIIKMLADGARMYPARAGFTVTLGVAGARATNNADLALLITRGYTITYA